LKTAATVGLVATERPAIPRSLAALLAKN